MDCAIGEIGLHVIVTCRTIQLPNPIEKMPNFLSRAKIAHIHIERLHKQLSYHWPRGPRP